MTSYRIPAFAFLFFIAHPVLLYAQHNDIKFDYQNNKIDIKPNILTGDRVGVGPFLTSGLFRQATDLPGFASEPDTGLGVNPFDAFVYNVLDDLLYWDGTEFVAPDPSTHIRILHNAGEAETIVSGSSGVQLGGISPLKNFVAQADDEGFIHDHIEYCLEPNSTCAQPVQGPSPTEFGAYGIKLSLSTNAEGIADSDPFFLVFNYDLDSAAFDNAVEQFAGLLPPDIPGDYDRDDVVDGDDYVLWGQEYGSPAVTPGSGADGNSNGVVEGSDFLFWQRHFGLPALAATSNGVLSVPEPSTAMIAAGAFGGILAFGHRSRKSSRLLLQS